MQIAIKFVDLHDTPGRMVAKKAVRKIVPCTEARSFFYWRLQRRLAEQRIKKQIAESGPSLTGREIDSLLRRWADQSGVFEGWFDSLISSLSANVVSLFLNMLVIEACGSVHFIAAFAQ